MKSIFINLSIAAIISFMIVLPFILLELVNNKESFPVLLFGLLLLLPIIFIVTLLPIIRNVRAGNSIMVNPVILLVRVSFLALIAIMWGAILIDQMPCFLGVANCD